MLAVFEESIGKAPEELRVPAIWPEKSKNRPEIEEMFSNLWPDSIFYSHLGGQFMAFLRRERPELRSIVVKEDVFCVFMGSLDNLCDIRRHYGLSRHIYEALLVVELYSVYQERAPYPIDQVVGDLVGKFAFILFDTKKGTLFVARDRGGAANLNWGVCKDQSLVFSDQSDTILKVCENSWAPFPAGFMFWNQSGLQSFIHPLHKVRAIPRVDPHDNKCGALFQVDLFNRVKSIPRVGSTANWMSTTTNEGE
ncbi:hypothetical protein AMTRI_Chr07g81980 [Amborella trichopoda]